MQKVTYEDEKYLKDSNNARVWRHFSYEDIELLKETFRKSNLQLNDNKQNNDDKTK